jgi:glyoxylase-like metal-dependent hydrolase (beta-lactamase superfamily II)
MRQLLFTTLLLISAHASCSGILDANADHDARASLSALQRNQWIHGSADCDANTDPAIEVYRYDHSSYILRQNKCDSFEAPFIYVLMGEERILVLDTGATTDLPLYETVQTLLREQSGQTAAPERELLVIHSHSHSDHYKSDSQFEGRPNVILVAPNSAAMRQFFAFGQWPAGEANLDLGGRNLTIIPTPGHQEEAISVYDSQTKWLLTGDTFYPGYIYVKHWDEYKASIERLVTFSNTHTVSAVLGAHIEMTSTAGDYYPIGTVHQPDEASLALSPTDLHALDLALKASEKPQEISMHRYIVAPMNGLQKALSNIAGWIVN